MLKVVDVDIMAIDRGEAANLPPGLAPRGHG